MKIRTKGLRIYFKELLLLFLLFQRFGMLQLL